MRNIKLTIRYDGTRYCGWQFQKNAKSVQEVMERRLKKITGEKVYLKGAGRTDAGVHAKAQAANFKTRSRIPLKNLQMALNSNLPKDITVIRAEDEDLKFDAQRGAKSKIYRYTIFNNDFLDPFLRRYAAKCFYKLDMALMRKASSILVGKHDFTSFRTKDGEEKNSVRTVKSIKIAKKGDLVYIDIEADGFLYNMARNIAGTLIEVARGKIGADHVRHILAKKDRRFCGPKAPARGLCLIRVIY